MASSTAIISLQPTEYKPKSLKNIKEIEPPRPDHPLHTKHLFEQNEISLVLDLESW